MSLFLGLLVCLGSFGLLWGAIRASRRATRVALASIGVLVYLVLALMWIVSTGKDQPKPGDAALLTIGGFYFVCAIWSLVLVFMPVRGEDYRSRKRFSADAADLKPSND